MFLKNLFRRLCGKKTLSVSSHSSRPGLSPRKTYYSQRYEETSGTSDVELDRLIADREYERKPCGVAYRVKADRSDERAKQCSIDPPRPGRKTYSKRHAETSAMSTSAIRSLITQREAQGKECGILYRVLSEQT